MNHVFGPHEIPARKVGDFLWHLRCRADPPPSGKVRPAAPLFAATRLSQTWKQWFEGIHKPDQRRRVSARLVSLGPVQPALGPAVARDELLGPVQAKYLLALLFR